MAIDFNASGTSGAGRSNQTGAPVGKPNVAAERPAADTGAATHTAATGSPVQLSNQAQQLQAIEERLRELPEVDSARVAQIKTAIADGSYKIDSSRIADKLMALEG